MNRKDPLSATRYLKLLRSTSEMNFLYFECLNTLIDLLSEELKCLPEPLSHTEGDLRLYILFSNVDR